MSEPFIAVGSKGEKVDPAEFANALEVLGDASDFPLVVIVGDSTADWFMPTGTMDPPHPQDEPGEPYIKNQKIWTAMLERELRSRGPVKFSNLAVAGSTLGGIDSDFTTIIDGNTPTDGQDATIYIVGGHNDHNSVSAAVAYSRAEAIRAKGVTAGFTKFILVCPTCYHLHGTKPADFSALAVADIGTLWDHVIDQGYGVGFSLGWRDGVHQNADGHNVLFHRVMAECYDHVDLLTAIDLDCGPGGWFPTVRAAMEWKQMRRAYTSPAVRDYRVMGDIFCEWLNLADATEANHYGDGVWIGNGGSANNILLMPGVNLNVQARVNYLDGGTEPPSAFTLRGPGRVTLLSNLNLLESFNNVPTRISCDEFFNPSGIPWVGYDYKLQSKLIDFSSATLNGIGGLYGDATYDVTVGPDSLIRSDSGFIINSHGAAGVRILPGCKLVRLDGGVVDNPGGGTIYFYPGVFMSNLTVGAGNTWNGTTPTLLAYTDM